MNEQTQAKGHEAVVEHGAGPRTTRAEVSTRVVRRVYAAQLVGAIVDGFALTTAVLYFTIEIGLPAGFVGIVLAAGALAALLLAPVLGGAADRFGLGRAAVVYSVLAALALAGYALAADGVVYAVSAVLFLVSQAGLAATRQALVTVRIPAEERVRARAVMQTLLNAGMGLGAALGAIVLAAGSRPPFTAGFIAGAAVMLGCAVFFARLPRTDESPDGTRPTRPRLLLALRDRRFMGNTGLATILQLTMPILSVLLPVWIAERTNAPTWVAAALLGINTVLVMCFQTTVAARARTAKSAARTAGVAAGCLAVACLLIGLSALAALTPVTATLVLIVGVLALTLGEMCAGAASWRAAFDTIPPGADGQYQAVFGMASSGARIVGPALALPLILLAGLAGWGILAAAVALSAVVLGIVLRRESASLVVRAGAEAEPSR
jgi:MFS family permease